MFIEWSPTWNNNAFAVIPMLGRQIKICSRQIKFDY